MTMGQIVISILFLFFTPVYFLLSSDGIAVVVIFITINDVVCRS